MYDHEVQSHALVADMLLCIKTKAPERRQGTKIDAKFGIDLAKITKEWAKCPCQLRLHTKATPKYRIILLARRQTDLNLYANYLKSSLNP